MRFRARFCRFFLLHYYKEQLGEASNPHHRHNHLTPRSLHNYSPIFKTLLCKMLGFALQYAAYWAAKCRVLQAKMQGFAKRYVYGHKKASALLPIKAMQRGG